MLLSLIIKSLVLTSLISLVGIKNNKEAQFGPSPDKNAEKTGDPSDICSGCSRLQYKRQPSGFPHSLNPKLVLEFFPFARLVVACGVREGLLYQPGLNLIAWLARDEVKNG